MVLAVVAAQDKHQIQAQPLRAALEILQAHLLLKVATAGMAHFMPLPVQMLAAAAAVRLLLAPQVIRLLAAAMVATARHLPFLAHQ